MSSIDAFDNVITILSSGKDDFFSLSLLAHNLACLTPEQRERIEAYHWRKCEKICKIPRTYKKFGNTTKAQEKFGIDSCPRDKYHYQPESWKEMIRQRRG